MESGGIEMKKSLANQAAQLAENGNYQEAIPLFEKLAGRSKYGSEAYFRARRNLANCHFGMGDPMASIRESQAILELNPDDRMAALVFAKSLIELGRVDLAEEILAPLAECGDIDEAPLLLAQILIKNDNHSEAVDRLNSILPNHREGLKIHYLLGEAHKKSGEREKAIESYKKCLAIDPADSFGVQAEIALLTGNDQVELGREFVENLFDGYAGQFEKHLSRLNYSAPQSLLQELEGHLPVESFLDLGCGTGLMAKALEGKAKSIDGVDLSEKMVERARITHLYQNLHHAGLEDYLERNSKKYDLVVASDVLVYCGDLSGIFGLVHKSLAEEGVFAFTLEAHDQEKDYCLQESRRFSHSKTYIASLADKFGFRAKTIKSLSTRP